MNPSEFREGEYLVVGTPIIDTPLPLIEDQDGFPQLISIKKLKELEVKTYVKDYDKATYHLLAVAEKIRNYAAYVTKARLPLTFDMVGKRRDKGFCFLPVVIFDGTTHLPLTDGGQKDISIFTTRFGPYEGVKPPSKALETFEQLNKWLKALNMKLTLAQNLLDNIKNETSLDIAVSSLGESIWVEGAKEQLTARWRAIEAITKIDHQERQIKSYMLFETLQKRAKAPLGFDEFKRLRHLRNVSTHSAPPQEQSADVHQAAYELFQLAYEITESALREERFPFL